MILIMLGFISGLISGSFIAAGIMFGILGAILGWAIAGLIGSFLPSKYVLDGKIELAALKDRSGIGGSFFLGCGSIASDQYYVFYAKNEDGSVTFKKLLADKVRVYEEQRKDGIIEILQEKYKWSYYIFAAPITDGPKYKIRIPEGSIQRNFKLDLE